MSPRFRSSSSSRSTASGSAPGASSSWNGNDRMSVDLRMPRNCMLYLRIVASVVNQMPTSNSEQRNRSSSARVTLSTASTSMGMERCVLRMSTVPTRCALA